MNKNDTLFEMLQNLRDAHRPERFLSDRANDIDLTPFVTALYDAALFDFARSVEYHWAELRLSVESAARELQKKDPRNSDPALIP